MHDVDRARGDGRPAEPVDRLVRVRVDREVGERDDLRPHRHVVPVDLHLARTFGELATARALGLVAGEHDAVAPVGQLVGEVVHDPTARCHPRRGDDDAGGAGPVEPHRPLDVVDGVHVRSVEVGEELTRLGAELWSAARRRPSVAVQRGEGHRAVDEDRDVRDVAALHQPPQLQEHQLGAVDGEGRDQHAPAPGHRAADRVGQQLRVRWWVPPVAVRRLDHDRVRLGRVGRRPQERVVRTSEVAAEGHPLPSQAQRGGGGAEDVSRRAQREGDVRSQPQRVLEVHRLDQLQCLLDVAVVVQRERGAVPGEAGVVGVAGVLLLQVGAVPQDDGRQVGGLGGARHPAAETVLDQPRQVAGVVEVGMGEHDVVDACRVDGEGVPVAAPVDRQALVEPGVDQHADAAGLHEEATARDGVDGAQEGERRDGGGVARCAHGTTLGAAAPGRQSPTTRPPGTNGTADPRRERARSEQDPHLPRSRP